MSVARSQRFIYFQNKASHYQKLRNIKSSIDDHCPKARIPKPKVYRPLPLLRQHEIEVQNEKIVDRLATLSKSPRTQVEAQGDYSRYHKVDRPFRSLNPSKAETDRSISIDNCELKNRLEKSKPMIGTHDYWNRQYSKSINCKRNLSKYLHNNQSKGELHISTERFIPQHLRDYGINKSLNESVTGKNATISVEKLFALPHLKNKDKRIQWHFDQLSKICKDEQP